MATKTALYRFLLNLFPDTGAEPTFDLDSASMPVPLPALEHLQYTVKQITLAPAADDQAVTFTAAIMLVVVGDGAFGLRLAAGETLLTNSRMHAFVADDEDASVHETSILLTGNGASTVNVTVIIVEKP